MGTLFSNCRKRKSITSKSIQKSSQKDEVELSTISIPIIYEIIDNTNRKKVWLQYLHIKEDDLNNPIHKKEYEIALQVGNGSNPIDLKNYPLFGSSFVQQILSTVSSEQQYDLVELFILIRQMNDLPYCPQLPAFIIILYYIFSKEEIYYIISQLLTQSFIQRYIITNSIFLKQLISYYSKQNHNQNQLFTWLCTCLIDQVDSQSVFLLFDGFIQSGYLFFIELFILLENGKEKDMNLVSESVKLAENEWKNWNCIQEKIKQIDVEEDSYQEGLFQSLCLQGESHLMNNTIWQEILQVLPKQMKGKTLQVIYSSFKDGYWVKQLISLAGNSAPTFLLLELENKDKIGVYREDKWINNTDAYGSINTYLLLFQNNQVFYWKGQQVDGFQHVIYIRSSDDAILIGASGKKGIALHISQDLLQGYSEESDVFQSPALQSSPFFTIQNIELYSII